MFLPLCFLWSFVACVVICSDDVEQKPEAYIISLASEVSSSDKSDCCPIANLPASLLPERPSFTAQIGSDFQILPAPSLQPLPVSAYQYGHNTIGPSPHGTPLERLCVLRI